MTATEIRLRDIEKRIRDASAARRKVNDIILSSLEYAIDEWLTLKDCSTGYNQRTKEISFILDDWLNNENGKIAVNRLTTLMMY